jgi:hypothetical protein
VLLEILDVGLASQKPKQLVSDKAKRNPFGRKQWKGVLEREPHLSPEEAAGARAGPIGFGISAIQYPLQEFEVLLFHDESALGSLNRLGSAWIGLDRLRRASIDTDPKRGMAYAGFR